MPNRVVGQVRDGVRLKDVPASLSGGLGRGHQGLVVWGWARWTTAQACGKALGDLRSVLGRMGCRLRVSSGTGDRRIIRAMNDEVRLRQAWLARDDATVEYCAPAVGGRGGPRRAPCARATARASSSPGRRCVASWARASGWRLPRRASFMVPTASLRSPRPTPRPCSSAWRTRAIGRSTRSPADAERASTSRARGRAR